MVRKKLLKIITSVAGVTIMLTVLTTLFWYQVRAYADEQEVFFLNVGQGDSTLIRTSNGHMILIDGGPDNSVLDRIGRNVSFADRSFDIVVATHPDADHIGGLVSVLERYQVDLFLDPCVVHDSAVFEALQEVLIRKQIPVRCVTQLQEYDLGEGVSLKVLYPYTSLVGKQMDDNNDASIALLFSHKEVDFLFTGDASVVIEEKIIKRYEDLIDIEILKIGHHGSDTSSSDAFLEITSPEIGVISSALHNRYGHPHPRVMNRLQKHSIPVLRTDTFGDIHMVSDGEFVYWKDE